MAVATAVESLGHLRQSQNFPSFIAKVDFYVKTPTDQMTQHLLALCAHLSRKKKVENTSTVGPRWKISGLAIA